MTNLKIRPLLIFTNLYFQIQLLKASDGWKIRAKYFNVVTESIYCEHLP